MINALFHIFTGVGNPVQTLIYPKGFLKPKNVDSNVQISKYLG